MLKCRRRDVYGYKERDFECYFNFLLAFFLYFVKKGHSCYLIINDIIDIRLI